MSEIRPPLTPEETDKINLPSGISLREYLAGQALNGIMANGFNDFNINKSYPAIAQEIIVAVDTLLAELMRTAPPKPIDISGRFIPEIRQNNT